MTQDITSLIEKLEGAEVGSRELDALVFRHFGEPLPDSFATMKVDLTWQDDGTAVMPIGDMQVTYQPPAYSTSLDAALALAERVLTMGAWDVGYTYNSDRPYYARLVIVRDDEGQPEIYGRAASPALALCAATLRAQSEVR